MSTVAHVERVFVVTIVTEDDLFIDAKDMKYILENELPQPVRIHSIEVKETTVSPYGKYNGWAG